MVSLSFNYNKNAIMFIIVYHQTHDMISIYPLYIISCLYPVSYHIISLSYPDHQTDLNIFN